MTPSVWLPRRSRFWCSHELFQHSAQGGAALALLACLPVAPAARAEPPGKAAERAAHYEEALSRAKATGKDIVVLQRGSDWNRQEKDVALAPVRAERMPGTAKAQAPGRCHFRNFLVYGKKLY